MEEKPRGVQIPVEKEGRRVGTEVVRSEEQSEQAGPELSIVIPVYNEEENIPPLLGAISRVMQEVGLSYEVICVDDGSTDKSYAVLREMADHYPGLVLIRFQENAGQTAALDAGFKAARGRIIVTMDADLQNDPADIPVLLEALQEYDMVCGWRYQRQDPWIKLVSARIANAVRNWITQEQIRDTGCSLKAYRRECLASLKLFTGMHRFLPTLVKMEGFRVTEVKVRHHPRRHGKSKYNIRNRLVSSFLDCLAVAWMQKRALRYKIVE